MNSIPLSPRRQLVVRPIRPWQDGGSLTNASLDGWKTMNRPTEFRPRVLTQRHRATEDGTIRFASMPLCLCVIFCLMVWSPAAGQPPKDALDRDYTGELPRIAATEPTEALKTFH